MRTSISTTSKRSIQHANAVSECKWNKLAAMTLTTHALSPDYDKQPHQVQVVVLGEWVAQEYILVYNISNRTNKRHLTSFKQAQIAENQPIKAINLRLKF